MHMLLLLLPSALAGNAEVGGAVDLIAGVAFAGDTSVASFGVQQAEADLKVGGDGFAFVMQLDTAATVSGDGLLVYSLAPERLTVGGGGRGWRAWGGVFPGIFRLESVDPWRRQAVVASMASARVPGAVLGGGADFGSAKGGVSLLLGFAPATVDVFRLDDVGPTSLPLIAGARGHATFSTVEVAGGAWFGGGFDALGFGGLELASVIDLGVVVPYVEFVSDLGEGHSGFVGADLFPTAIVSPGARVELDSTRGFGVGVSVASTAFEILRFKGEASYQAGNPGVYLEVAVMSKAPVDDDRFGRPQVLQPAPKPKKKSAAD